MRSVIVIVALLLLGGNAAFSADLPTKAPYYYPQIDWTGTYVGVSGGAAGGRFHGPLATFNAGINFQTYSQFVYGVEADLSFGRLIGGDCAGCDFEGRWLATARARAGYMFGRTLVFATAGVASGNIQTNGLTGASTSATKTGYALGGGGEFDLGQDWSLRTEYLHIDLGNFECGTICGTGSTRFRASSEIVRIGVVYRFFQETVGEYNVFGPPIKPPPF